MIQDEPSTIQAQISEPVKCSIYDFVDKSGPSVHNNYFIERKSLEHRTSARN